MHAFFIQNFGAKNYKAGVWVSSFGAKNFVRKAHAYDFDEINSISTSAKAVHIPLMKLTPISQSN